jgi:6-pyruvoyltetrahydropterin/6-carboxytetrahydropterin synthase
MHGHNYLARVTIGGPVDLHAGWIMDFAEVDGVVKPLVAEMDHRHLNDLPGLENPTAEVIAARMCAHIKHRIPGLVSVEVWETDHGGALVTAGGRP